MPRRGRGATPPAPKKVEKKSPEGLGDTVETVLEKTGIAKAVKMFTPEGLDCGCEERKKKLNELFPYRKPNCLTEEMLETWKKMRPSIKTTITTAQQDIILRTYAHVFNKKLAPCTSCASSGNTWMNIVKEIDKAVETYKEESNA